MARAKAKEEVKEEVVNETPEEELDEEIEDEAEDQTDPRIKAIRAAFVEAVDAEADEDGVKLKMVQAGAKFSEVTRLFNLYMVDFGFVKSKEEKNTILDDVLTNQDLTNETIFDTCAQAIMEQVEVSEKSANAMIRQWCKKNEVEYFRKPKATPQETLSSKILSWIIDNIEATDGDLVEFISEVGTENTIRNKGYWISTLDFAKRVKARYA